MNRKIKNPKATLAEVQKNISQVLSYIDTCESFINGTAKKIGVAYADKEEFQKYRKEIYDLYSKTEEYLVGVASDNGEELNVKSSPMGMGQSYESSIVNMEEDNKLFVLSGVMKRLEIMKSEMNSTLQNLSENHEFNGGKDKKYYMVVGETVGLLDTAVQMSYKKIMKVRVSDSESEGNR